MIKKHFPMYLLFSIVQIIIVISWTTIFRNNYSNVTFYSVGVIIFSQLFFWFGLSPKILYTLSKGKSWVKESMERTKLIIFLWIFLFGIGALFSLISPIINGEIEKIIFFFVPASLSTGAYFSWKYIKYALTSGQD